MTKKTWLNQTVMCDEWGRPPNLADIPMTYVTRQESFKRQKMTETEINKLYDRIKND